MSDTFYFCNLTSKLITCHNFKNGYNNPSLPSSSLLDSDACPLGLGPRDRLPFRRLSEFLSANTIFVKQKVVITAN